MKNRIISLLLVLFIVFSGLVFYSFAEDVSDDGSSDDNLSFEDQLDKENEKNNDGSGIKEFSNFGNEYFNNSLNIALYSEVTARGYDINENGGSDARYPKENIVDGDTETRFATYKTAKTGFVTLKFNEKRTFNKIVFSESSLSMREYTISYSNDGIKWTKIIDVEGMNGIKEDVKYYFDKNVKRDLTWQNIMDVENTISNLYSIHYFEPVNAQYLKFEVTRVANEQSTTAWGFKINEIGVYYEQEINYDRFDIAYKKASDYYNLVSSDGNDYDLSKVEKLKTLIDKYKTVKEQSYTQPQLEQISDELVIARVDVYRSRKFSDADFLKIKENVANNLNVNKDFTEKDDINQRAQDIKIGKQQSDVMIKGNTSLLWEDIGTFEATKYAQKPANIQTIYSRIRYMAMAATGNFSELKGDKTLLDNISYALKIADTYWYSPDIPWFDSSMWSQMLGTPPIYSDVLLMLQGYLPDSEIDYYANRLAEQMKNDYMNWNGVNRMNLALANAKVGAVLKEYWRIDNLRISVEEEFSYVDKTEGNSNFYVNNGYYSDGTFIYHDAVPYNAGYGQDGMAYNANGIVALNDSPWELPTDKLVSYFVNIIKEGYDPIVVDGFSMSMMMGRVITRGKMEQKKTCELARTIAMIVDIVDEPYRTEFKSMIKSWFDDGTTGWQSNINSDVRKILNDDSIPVREPLFLNKVYHFGDRIVHRRGPWSLGISMSSSRIKMYEGINNENKKGWYTGSGVTYIYNNDHKQFDDDFWYTVDMQRLPGITVEKAERSTARYDGEVVTPYDSVGGASLNKLYGTAHMEVYQWQSDLQARKSWYMFDDEVVCLGSNINSMSDNPVETVVDNRMINDSSVITVNNSAFESLNEKIPSVKTAHIKGRLDSQIGYYFPDSVSLNVLKDERTHKFSEVTAADLKREEETTTRTFATMYVDHGKAPENAKYSYVILPDKTPSQTEEYAENSNIEILANEEYCHAVRENTLGITAVNLFEDKKVIVDGVHLSDKCALIMSENDGEIELTISDTTKKNDGIINIVLDRKGKNVISHDENVTVNFDGSKVYIKFDMKNVKGEECSVKLEVEEKSSLLPSFQILAKAETLSSENFESEEIVEGTKLYKNDKAGIFNLTSASLAITNGKLRKTASETLDLNKEDNAELVVGNIIAPFKVLTNQEFTFTSLPEYLNDTTFFRLTNSWSGSNSPSRNGTYNDVLSFDINQDATVYYVYQRTSDDSSSNANWLNENGWTLCSETVTYKGSNDKISTYLLFKKEFKVSSGQKKITVKVGGCTYAYLPPLVFVDWGVDGREYLYTEFKKDDLGSGNKYLSLLTRKYAPESSNVPASLQITTDIRNNTKDKAYYQIDYSIKLKDSDVLRQFNPKYINGNKEVFSNMLISFQPGEDKEITIGSSKMKVGNYELDKWYNISMVLDVANSKADVYINNEKVTTNEIYLTIPGTPFSNNLSTLYFTQATKNFGEDDDSFYESYFDNFKVKTPDTPLVSSLDFENSERKPVTPEFSLIFSNDMEKGTDKKIKLRKSGTTEEIGIDVITEDYVNYTVSTKSGVELLKDTNYELVIEGAKDFYGNLYDKTFEFLTVEADYLLQIQSAISKAISDIPSVVTSDLTLPNIGIDDVILSWEFTPDNIITKDGKVTRDENDHEIVVKVTGNKKGIEDFETKTIKVPKLNITSNIPVSSDASNGSNITDDDEGTYWQIESSKTSGGYTLSFPEKTDFNQIEFLLDAPKNATYKIIDADTLEVVKEETLSQSITNDKLIINCDAFSVKNLKVSFEKAEGNEIKVYSMLLYVDEQAKIDLDAKELSIGDVSSVTDDLAFNFNGPRGTVISWLSSNTSVIANDGTVTRPTGSDVTVVVTATVSLPVREVLQNKTKTFNVTVKATTSQGGGSGSGGNGGGGGSFSVSDSSKEEKPVEPEVVAPSQPDVPKITEFSDVSESHWAKDYVYALKEKGIINGISETQFAPDNSVTREQFIKMLVLALGLKEETTTTPFKDVVKNEWYESVVATAYNNGIILGNGETFGIGENITRQDVCVMVFRAIENKKLSSDKESDFTDSTSISDYAKKSIDALYSYGILSGYEDGSFRPKNTLTRAESAKIIYTLIELI